MRSSFFYIILLCYTHINVIAQEPSSMSTDKNNYSDVSKHTNKENCMSANITKLKKGYSHYIVVNDTIYTSSDVVLLGIHEYTSHIKVFWSIKRWVIDADSIKCVGYIKINYGKYYTRINKFKFKIKDGYIYWRKRFTRRIRGKFPCSMIDKGGTIYLSDIICHEK